MTPIKGIIGVDAGVTTGLAWGLFNPELRDKLGLWIALQRGRRTGWAEIGPSSGGRGIAIRQSPKGELAVVSLARGVEADTIQTGLMVAKVVMDQIADWQINAPGGTPGLGVDNVMVVIEDFQIRRDLRGATGRDKLAPVFVAGLLAGVLAGSGWGPSVTWSSPSVSKSLASDARLKRWASGPVRGRAGWIKGRRHARDAFRLVATGLETTP